MNLLKRLISILFCFVWSLLVTSIPVKAGEINSYEAALISEARGIFEYGGNKYRAKESYLSQLEDKLKEENMDLTESQVSSLISQMYASVGEGVSQGILELVEETVQIETDILKETEVQSTVLHDGEEKLLAGQETDKNTQRETEKDTAEQTKTLEEDSEESASEEITSETETINDIVTEETNKSSAEKLPYDRNVLSETKKDITHRVLPGMSLVLLAAAAGITVGIKINKRKQRIRKLGILAENMDFYTDIHSHILPNADDGADSVDTACRMLKQAYEEGFRKIIVTPHYHMGHTHRTPEELQRILNQIQVESATLCPGMEFALGNELFYSDGIVDCLTNGDAFTLNQSKYVLVEFHPGDSFRRIQDGVTRLMRAGYIPVIAHVERYPCLMEKMSRMEELKQSGVWFQMNIRSVPRCKKLLREGFIDVLGTDCHNNSSRSPIIKEYLPVLADCCSEEMLEQILKKNPDDIWNHRYH